MKRHFRTIGYRKRLTPLILMAVLVFLFAASAAFALTGDLDSDCNVDRDDLNILLADRNKTVNESACGVACDLDGDGVITVLDARKLVLLCTGSRGVSLWSRVVVKDFPLTLLM